MFRKTRDYLSIVIHRDKFTLDRSRREQLYSECKIDRY